MTKVKRLWSTLVALSVLLLALIVPSYAADSGTITLSYPLSDTEFNLYRVGTYDGNGGYTLTGRFADYPITMDSENAATTLEAYITVDELEPDATATTDASGKLTFTDLEPAAYLILGQSSGEDETGEYTYTPSPVLLSVTPGNPDVTVNAKYEKTAMKEIAGPEIDIDWDNPDHPDNSDVNTKAKNGSVIEEVPDGYTVDISKSRDANGNLTYIMTNSKIGNSSSTQTASTLPRTGQYWWPVSAMASLGVIFVLVGLIRRKKYE